MAKFKLEAPGGFAKAAITANYSDEWFISWPPGPPGRHDVIVATDIGEDAVIEVIPNWTTANQVGYEVPLPAASANQGNAATLTFSPLCDGQMPTVRLRIKLRTAAVGSPHASVGAH